VAPLIDPEALLAGRPSDLGRPSTAAIRLSGVTRVFGINPALVRVDLVVERGETVLVRGSNGAGKSTLLRLIATALSPTFGSGSVLGFDLITGREEIRRRTELMGHQTRLYEDLTAAENLRFVCTVYGLEPGGAEAALREVGLEDVAGERVRGFSQGMRQRVALARLLLRRPELLLLDEPYAGLDEAAKDVVDGAIRSAQGEGRTVILATHDPARGAMASRSLSMEGGRLRPASAPGPMPVREAVQA
jgi:heme ABC exporter ATP-binding subunit CcmA